MSADLPQKPVKLVRKRLDDAGVTAHLASLARDAKELEIRTKGTTAAHSDAAAPELDEITRRLIAGEIAAVQLRFSLDGTWWCDTIVRKGDDFRLVRMEQLEGP